MPDPKSPVPPAKGTSATPNVWEASASGGDALLRGWLKTNPFLGYMIDATERSILFWDIMRERGNQFIEHNEKATPNVLSFDFEIVMTGADLPRPVNYGLARILPPEGVEIDETKRPIVVIDPRAGHLAGISGFKAESEFGYGLQEGHPCYLIGFVPEPEEGQTIEDVMRAEVAFIEKVVALHPKATHKPFVIGNCQGGWATMMLASYRPDLCGPLLLAGSPLTYWAGVHGKNPMRYSGGMLGGTWLTRLTSDMGDGIFDGAWLVANFEGMNPGNTLWTKQYNVYAKADTEAERYLGFEKYWGGYALLNGEEMQFIVDNLFVGNTLPTGGVTTTDGVTLDYRKITSPIICFCSWGDNITPPQQALGWILDLYADVDEIRARGQTIVYAIHEKIGHLGIFVSGSVTSKQHQEFMTNIDFVDVLPPGLYELVIETAPGASLEDGVDPSDYTTSFEPRTLNDIRALGGNDAEDERRFEAVSRMSDINNSLYRMYAQPWAQAMGAMLPQDAMRDMHPSRMVYTMLSDKNPFMAMIKPAAEMVRQNRHPVAPDNPLWQAQESGSDAMVHMLDQFGELRDGMIEAWFLATFGNPALQAALGMDNSDGPPRPAPGTAPEHKAFVTQRIAELKAQIPQGGLREAFVRAVLYVSMSDGKADERRFAVFQSLLADEEGTLEDLKRVGREQFFMLHLDETAAVAALPDLVGDDPEARAAFIGKLRNVCEAAGPMTEDRTARLEQLSHLLGVS